MSEAEPLNGAREFDAKDARQLARDIIDSDAGRECQWSPAAVDIVAGIILWEVLTRGPSNVVAFPVEKMREIKDQRR